MNKYKWLRGVNIYHLEWAMANAYDFDIIRLVVRYESIPYCRHQSQIMSKGRVDIISIHYENITPYMAGFCGRIMRGLHSLTSTCRRTIHTTVPHFIQTTYIHFLLYNLTIPYNSLVRNWLPSANFVDEISNFSGTYIDIWASTMPTVSTKIYTYKVYITYIQQFPGSVCRHVYGVDRRQISSTSMKCVDEISNF